MQIFGKRNTQVTIDGRSFSGTNISIKNNKVIVDGVVQEGDLTGPISVAVSGDIDKIDAGSCDTLVAGGNVGSIKSGSGDIDCGDVSGDIQTGSGDVDCNNVGGQIQTGSGDVSHR